MKTKNNLDQEIKSVLEEFDDRFVSVWDCFDRSRVVAYQRENGISEIIPAEDVKSFLSSTIREQVEKAIDKEFRGRRYEKTK